MFEFDLHFTIAGAYFAVAKRPESKSGSAGFAKSHSEFFFQEIGHFSLFHIFTIQYSYLLNNCVLFFFKKNISYMGCI